MPDAMDNTRIIETFLSITYCLIFTLRVYFNKTVCFIV